MVKSACLLLLCCFVVLTGMAQKKNETIAPFLITLTSGRKFTYKQLENGRPVTLIYFSPDCEHCINFAKAMLKRIEQLKDRQIVMVTYLPLADVQAFDNQYRLSSYPNIKIGTEGYTFIVQKYYQVHLFPYIIVYNKQGRQVKIISDQKLKPEVMAAQL